MTVSRMSRFITRTLLLGVTAASAVNAGSFSFSGTFSQDDNVALYAFNVISASMVTLQTWSYGGGTNALGQSVASGGFFTVLSLYSGTGTYIDSTINGACPPGNIDGASGLCGDAFLNESLNTGSYLLAVTEYFNVPNGDLSTGFLESGQGNFTGPSFCGISGAFYDPGCNQRNGNFELDIVGANTASFVPEPASLFTAGLAFSCLTCLGVLKRARRCGTPTKRS